MAMQEMWESFKLGSTEFLGKLSKKKYLKVLFITLGVIGLLIIGFFIHKYYVNKKNQTASRVFSECLDEYYKALANNYEKEKGSQEKVDVWGEVETMFKQGYQQYSSSNLAPYFLLFESESLSQQGKKDESLSLLRDGLKRLSQSSPFYFIYKTKELLMSLDKGEDVINELTQLARNRNNPNNDLALYYLGEYYWVKNDIEMAKGFWSELIREKSKSEMPSPWAKLASLRLQQ